MSISQNVRLGLLPATPAKPRLKLSPFLTSKLPDASASADYLSRVGSWDLYKNDLVGDCGPAGLAHWVTAAGSYGDLTPFTATTQNVLDFYSAVSGYDQRTGQNDNGVVLQEMLEVARKQGAPGGMPIVAFAEVNVADLNEVKAAIDLFGHVIIGANLPISASTQLDNRQKWDVVSGHDGIPGGWGGHCVHVGAYGNGEFVCTTWGQTQVLTEAWWTRYVAEAFIAIPSTEWITPQGVTPTGLDLHGLGEELARLTGGSNPFPAPAPTPVTPAPAPVEPTPVPVTPAPAQPVSFDEVDAALWLRIAPWTKTKRVGANKIAQDQVKTWATAKGLR